MLGYIRGERYSLAVDAGNSRRHVEKFYAALDAAELRRPDFTVLTHWHWDHTFVFDEPTSGLDYHRMLEVSNMIRKLNDENKVIIIVSHDFEFLGRTCDKIFDMEGCSIERR